MGIVNKNVFSIVLYFQTLLKPGGTVSLWRVFIQCFYKLYLIAGFCKLVSSLLLTVAPIIIEHIILFVIEETEFTSEEDMLNSTTTEVYDQV